MGNKMTYGEENECITLQKEQIILVSCVILDFKLAVATRKGL